MVSRIIISIALLCSSVAFSQEESALKFNQVLLVELTEEGIIVPEGKVWKIVSAVSEAKSLLEGGESYFFVNNNKSEIHQLSSWVDPEIPNPEDSNDMNAVSFSSTFSSTTAFPMWLPSGVNLSLGENVSALSIIEFNIN
jgi:hypothetical protein